MKKGKVKLLISIIALDMVLLFGFIVVEHNKTYLKSMPVNVNGDVTNTFYSEDEVIQTFFGFLSDINQLEILFSKESIGANVEISVYNNSNGKYYYLSEKRISSEACRLSLNSALDDSYGHEFYLKIRPLDNKGISLLLADTFYPDNHLLINGIEDSTDIAMSQYSAVLGTGYWIGVFAALFALDLLIILAFLAKRKEKDNSKRNDKQGNQDVILNLVKLLACVGVLVAHITDNVGYQGTFVKLLFVGSYFPLTFYVISGYTNMSSYEKTPKLSVYYIKRAFRILPLYYFTILMIYIYTVIASIPTPSDEFGLGWFQYVFLIQTTLPNENNFWDNICATWTVPFFIVYYALMPMLKRVFNSYLKSLVGTIVLGYLQLYTMYSLFFWLEQKGFKNASTLAAQFPTQTLFVFLLGMTCWYAKKENKRIGFVLLMTGITLLAQDYFATGMTFAIPFTGCSAIFVVFSDKISIKNVKVREIINNLSQYSYALYLVHPLVLYIISSNNIKAYFGDLLWFYVVCVVLLVCILTYIAHNTIELYAGTICKRICKKLDRGTS